MKWMLMVLSLGICMAPEPGFAQQTMSVPADAKFVVQVDLAAFKDTKLGERLVRVTADMAQHELGGDADDIIAKVSEALGFNPLEEMRTLTIIGSDFEHPEKNLRFAMRLGKTSGNLEGLMLAAPGYQSEQMSGYTIHSAREGDMQAFAVIHTGQDGNKTVLAASHRSDITDMLAALGVGENFRKRNEVSWSVPEGTFAHVQVLQFPDEVYEHNPPGNLARMIQDLSLSLSEEGDDYRLNLVFSTADEQRAEQFLQLAQGAKALVSLFEEEIKEDEDAKMLMSLLDEVAVTRDDLQVSVKLLVPQQMVVKFLREEADLPL
jgi:hypothetical protein